MSKTKEKGQVTDELISSLADTINKKFKDQKMAYLLSEEESPSDVTDFVGTGSSQLDLAIANRPDGGFPCGRIIELTGLEGAGKSLLAAHALANTQKKGGVAVYIDTENAISKEFLTAIGVDLKKLLYIPCEAIEDCFEAIESIITKVRETNKDKIVTIVTDSVAGATTKEELAGNFDEKGYNTGKALLMSMGLRKITNMIGRQKICLIFTNQLRTKLNAMAFGEKWETPAGKALPFHASVRIRLVSVGKIKIKKEGRDEVVGVKTKATVVKNRIGPPFRSAEYNIYFNTGIDDTASWLESMKLHKLVGGNNRTMTYVNKNTGEEIEFTSQDFEKKILGNTELKDQIYKDICEKSILKYNPDEDRDLVELDKSDD